eukprot:5205532-Pyramimonas_sp.AAC.1
MGTEHWDFILFNETWRTAVSEMWEIAEGHIFARSGHDQPSHGVGVLVHKRWGKHIKQFQGVSARLAALHIRRGSFKL